MTTKATTDTPAATADKQAPHWATRRFKDEGTTRSFAKDAPLKECTDGELANYVAAGLATTEKPDAKPAA